MAAGCSTDVAFRATPPGGCLARQSEVTPAAPGRRGYRGAGRGGVLYRSPTHTGPSGNSPASALNSRRSAVRPQNPFASCGTTRASPPVEPSVAGIGQDLEGPPPRLPSTRHSSTDDCGRERDNHGHCPAHQPIQALFSPVPFPIKQLLVLLWGTPMLPLHKLGAGEVFIKSLNDISWFHSSRLGNALRKSSLLLVSPEYAIGECQRWTCKALRHSCVHHVLRGCTLGIQHDAT